MPEKSRTNSRLIEHFSIFLSDDEAWLVLGWFWVEKTGPHTMWRIFSAAVNKLEICQNPARKAVPQWPDVFRKRSENLYYFSPLFSSQKSQFDLHNNIKVCPWFPLVASAYCTSMEASAAGSPCRKNRFSAHLTDHIGGSRPEKCHKSSIHFRSQKDEEEYPVLFFSAMGDAMSCPLWVFGHFFSSWCVAW